MTNLHSTCHTDSLEVLKLGLNYKFQETDLNRDGKINWDEFSKKNGND